MCCLGLVFLHTQPPWAELLLKSRSTPRTGCRDEEGWDPLSWNPQAGHTLSPAHKESMQYIATIKIFLKQAKSAKTKIRIHFLGHR